VKSRDWHHEVVGERGEKWELQSLLYNNSRNMAPLLLILKGREVVNKRERKKTKRNLTHRGEEKGIKRGTGD